MGLGGRVAKRSILLYGYPRDRRPTAKVRAAEESRGIATPS